MLKLSALAFLPLAAVYWVLDFIPRDLWIAALLGVIEGVTEFVPISSTGHLLLAQHYLALDMQSGFWRMFTVFIQIGAILAVVVYFRDRLRELWRASAARRACGLQSVGSSPIAMILIATVPVLLAGLLLNDWVDENMQSPRAIAYAVGIGGIIMLLLELTPRKAVTDSIERMSLPQAILIGCAQIFAVVFPGTSRSAATIMGGLVAGLSRPAAAEFSFFLAIPAMFAACGYSLVKQLRSDAGITAHEALVLAVGTVVSFVVAWIVIAAFMNFIRKHTFIPFAIYRMALAVVVFLWV